MSFLFSQPAPGILPPDSVSFDELAEISANSILGNPTGTQANAVSVDSNLFFISTATNRIGIGSTSPNAKLQINNSGSQLGLAVYSTSSNNTAELYNQGTTNYTLALNSAANSALTGASIGGYFARGTLSSRTQTLSQDSLLSISASGYTGSGVAGISAAVVLGADENTQANAYGGQIVLATTPNSTPGGFPVPRMYVKNDGKVNIPDLTASQLLATDVSKNLVSLSSTTATSYLDSFAGSIKGLVPASSNTGTLFLRDDGTWVAAGGVTDVTATAPLASSGGLTPDISISQADSTTDGYLSSVDWNTFDSKQPAGDYITDLTGEVTASGPGSVSATIAGQSGNGTKVLATNGTTVSWQYAGLGDGSFGTQSVILGRAGSSATQATIIGTTADATDASVAIGYNADAGNSVGFNTLAIGTDAYADKDFAIALGCQATTRNLNGIVVGYNSFTGSGSNSIVIGSNSGNNGASGANNTILGNSSAVNLTSGYSNVILGVSAAASQTDSSSSFQNVIIGNLADVGGRNAVSIGYQALAGITSVGIGRSCNVGNDSVGIGESAYSSGGVAVGKNARAVTGTVSIGYSANYPANGFYTVGVGNDVYIAKNYSVGIGNSARINGGGDNQIVVGYNSRSENSTNSIIVGTNSTVNNGTNNTIFGNSISAINAGDNNTLIGNSAGSLLVSGDNNIFLGYTAGDAVTTGSNNVIIGDIAGTTTLADTIILAAGTNERIRVDSSGNVGIGTSTPSAKLDVANGDIAISTEGKGLAIKAGLGNGKIGVASGISPITVSTTALIGMTSPVIFVTTQNGNDPASVVNINTTAGTFDIVHSPGVGSVDVAWMIVETA